MEGKSFRKGWARRMVHYFRQGIVFLKKETVLCIALLLAVLSSFAVLPDREYLGYIDFRTLAVLFCLMTVMSGFQELGVFGRIAERMLQSVKSIRGMVLILVMLCFVFSMLITNDVALITFVPFTFTVLKMAGEEQEKKLIVPVVVMQTIAANLGSMLTPVGNPQNLYLYGQSGMSMGQFFLLMLPFSLISLGMLVLWCLFQGKNEEISICTPGVAGETKNEQKLAGDVHGGKRKLIVYLELFLFCLLTVARILPYGITLVLVVAAVVWADRKVLARVDYALLLTFVGFFVFIGNMGRIPAFRSFLESVIVGHEVMTAVISSQVISNVPAAILLSGFTKDWNLLIIGTNLGGLGTLIASMASLISYKYICREAKEQRKRYLLYFTAANLVFLAVLLVCYYVGMH